MGLNFETMRYNGMGNRFRDMAGYHSLIAAHGVLAAITFLGLVPSAILIARFYSANPYWARRLHIWMQVLTVFLTTVVFVLGWFAVGPRRSLTNPHHGIGLAIYVLLFAQTFWGWFIHKSSRVRRRPHISLRLMLHHWLGRAIALLGIAQIPLGLTLYGSPLSLFILFALAAFILLFIYFILTYLHERRIGADYDARGTYSSGPEVVDDRHSSSVGRVAAAGAAGAGLTMLGSRFRRRSRSRSPTGGYSEGTSYMTEKETTGWGKRLGKAGAVVGFAALAKKWFDRRRDRESDTESGRYYPGHTVTDSMIDESVSRTEDGHRPPTPGYRRRYDGPLSPEQSRYTESEFTRPDEGAHGARNGVLGAGLFAGVRQFFRNRRERREQQRMEEIRRAEIEAERTARERSRRYTGDGYHPRRSGRYSPVTDLTEQTDSEAVETRPTDVPPALPSQVDELSGTDTVTSIGRRHGRHPSTAAAGRSSGHHHRSRGREESVDSQPVSIKVKMHDHGRRITLRQLTREEASASRENRRRDRHRRSSRNRRDGSLSGTEVDDHWRRVEELERQQAEEMQREAERTPVPSAAGQSAPVAPQTASVAPVDRAEPPPPAEGTIPSPAGFTPLPPPPIPAGPGAINSPMSTDLSSYASRSGRRRAERRTQGRGGRQHSVEFT
ncbi:hypothetical protein VTO42DRAFT_6710 [Malbranchea cinnamomea]